MAKFVDKLQKMWNPPDDEYEDYYEDEPQVPAESYDQYDEEQEERKKRSSFSSFSDTGFSNQGRGRDNNNLVNINAKAQLQVALFRPMFFGEETRAIADELLKRHTVVLNLENTDRDVSRRIVDFLSGVAYANNGKIKRIATNTFIITPYNVDLTGEEVLDELENSGLYF